MKKFKEIESLMNDINEIEEKINNIISKEERINYKKDLKKLNEKIDFLEKENNSENIIIEDKNRNINKINEFNEKINFINSQLKEIEYYESTIYSTKKKATAIVHSLDSKRNLINSNKLIFESKKIDLEKEIEIKKNPSIILEQISKKEEELQVVKNEISSLKNINKPTYLSVTKANFIQSELSTLKKRFKKIEKTNIDAFESKISILNNKIGEKQSEADDLRIEIKKYVELIDKCDSILSSGKVISEEYSFIVKNLNIFYGKKQAIYDLNIKIPKNKIISIIGPSGCGKSTFLRTLNRINDEIPNFSADGKILLDGEYDIYKLRSIKNKYDKIELTELRTKVGMIFQQPNPFPMSIYKNVIFGPKINGIKNKKILHEIAENSLKNAAIWDEVKGNLNALGTSLSGGQQQRLCIARAIANEPEILLMDEPTSALDPIAASKIEELMLKLKERYTLIIVTHSMQQAARVSDYTAFFYAGKLIEFDKTKKIFSNPKEKMTDDYIRGKFG